MGTYNLPRNVKGEGRILFIFTPKSLIYASVGAGVGLIFYLIFRLMKMGFVGIIIIAVFALIGYEIGMLKVPNIGVLKDTQAVGGENLDDVIKRAILFKRKGNKIYVYDNKEVETNDK